MTADLYAFFALLAFRVLDRCNRLDMSARWFWHCYVSRIRASDVSDVDVEVSIGSIGTVVSTMSSGRFIV